jgi:hypothetical protein
MLSLLTLSPAQALFASKALSAWILAAMLSAQPEAPWRDTYEATAEVFARVALEAPLFQGADGPRRTASWFVSVAWFEGRFDPQAKGDCRRKDKDGKCLSAPQSVCMFQIGVSNLAALGTTEPAILNDVEICTRAARRMMQTSMGVCRGRPTDELLGHYASGRGTCGGLAESRHRVTKARWLFDHVPFLPVEVE